MKSKKLLVFFVAFVYCAFVFAQTESKSEYIYKQKVYPVNFDCYYYAAYYHNIDEIFNMRGYTMSNPYESIVTMEINPSGTSYAVLTKYKNKTQVCIYDLWESDNRIYRFKKKYDTSALCYTQDAKSLILADSYGLKFYDAKSFQLTDSLSVSFRATELAVNNNGYFVAATDGVNLGVWNIEAKRLRLSFISNIKINAIKFSYDNKLFGVLTSDGVLTTYDTRQFNEVAKFDNLGIAKDFDFHPEGKYVSVVNNDSVVSLVNMKDETERIIFSELAAGISNVQYICGKDRNLMVYNTSNAIIYRAVNGLSPNYTQIVDDEANKMMAEWLKQLPDETMDDYKVRVNEEARMKQMNLFKQEVATRLADNLVSMSNVTLGKYNAATNSMEVAFDNMPSILLNVPEEDVVGFMDTDNIEFRNAKYNVMGDDHFELTYAEVFNKVTGKTYVYENFGKQNLDLLIADDNFVPLELVMQTNMEEMKLEEIKEKIIAVAKQENVISDHTNIAVNTNVVNDYDADGNKITNYVVDFSYEVEAEFSFKEDFGPGQYKLENSGAASSMLKIMKEAFESKLASYISAGKKLRIEITGMADAIPINRVISYDGCYGDFENEPIYKQGELSSIAVTKKGGIIKNEQLAFLRAQCVKDYMEKNVKSLSSMDTDYNYCIDIASGRGGEFRRIKVSLVFVDAF